MYGMQCLQLNKNIPESRRFHRAGFYYKSAGICRHLTEQSCICSATEDMQCCEVFACHPFQLLQSISVFQRQTFVNAPHCLSHCLRHRLTGSTAELLYSLRDVSGCHEFRCIRINKTVKSLCFVRQLRQFSEAILLSLSGIFSPALLDQPQSDNVFQIVNPAIGSVFIGQTAVAALLRQNRCLQFTADQAPGATGEKRCAFSLCHRHGRHCALGIMSCHCNDLRAVWQGSGNAATICHGSE